MAPPPSISQVPRTAPFFVRMCLLVLTVRTVPSMWQASRLSTLPVAVSTVRCMVARVTPTTLTLSTLLLTVPLKQQPLRSSISAVVVSTSMCMPLATMATRLARCMPLSASMPSTKRPIHCTQPLINSPTTRVLSSSAAPYGLVVTGAYSRVPSVDRPFRATPIYILMVKVTIPKTTTNRPTTT